MKFQFTPRLSGGPRPPLRTFKELAEEFGVTPGQLRGFMGHDKSAPAPEFQHLGTVQKNNWYRAAEMRQWWKARCAHV